jgi:hypothetical protein
MKPFCFMNCIKSIFSFLLLTWSMVTFSQNNNPYAGDFWQHLSYGGGLGLSIGSEYTDVTIAPSAVYNFNKYFATGVGLLGSYVDVKGNYSSLIYGGSVIALFNPIEAVQFSAELEQLRVNNDYDLGFGASEKDNFWNTALYLGAGYRNGNVTLGLRYNALFQKDKNVYGDAFMPFVRFYF